MKINLLIKKLYIPLVVTSFTLSVELACGIFKAIVGYGAR